MLNGSISWEPVSPDSDKLTLDSMFCFSKLSLAFNDSRVPPVSPPLTPDRGSPDGGSPDRGPVDRESPDRGPSDEGSPDGGPADRESPDRGPSDEGSPDRGSPDRVPAGGGSEPPVSNVLSNPPVSDIKLAGTISDDSGAPPLWEGSLINAKDDNSSGILALIFFLPTSLS